MQQHLDQSVCDMSEEVVFTSDELVRELALVLLCVSIVGELRLLLVFRREETHDSN